MPAFIEYARTTAYPLDGNPHREFLSVAVKIITVLMETVT